MMKKNVTVECTDCHTLLILICKNKQRISIRLQYDQVSVKGPSPNFMGRLYFVCVGVMEAKELGTSG